MKIFLVIWRSITKCGRFFIRLSKTHQEKRNDSANRNPGDGATNSDKEVTVVIRDGIGLFASGILAGVFFATGHNVSGLWCSFVGLAAAAHIPFNHWAIRKPKWRWVVWGLYSLSMTGIGVWFSLWSVSMLRVNPDAPRLSTQRIQLAADNEPIRNTVTVLNPSDFPLYDVTLRVAIDRIGIPADSVTIETDKGAEGGTTFTDVPTNPFRMDMSGSAGTNTLPDLVLFTIGFIPPKSPIELRISGSIKTNSWADLSIVRYEKNLAIPNWRSNTFEFVLTESELWKPTKGSLGYRLTPMTMPFGAMLFTNGIPAWTNLPHLMLALDASDFGVTTQLNLVNDLFSLKNNHPYIFEITGLLTIPASHVPPRRLLKMNLINDSALIVSNIDLFFNSSEFFEWSSNGVWRTGYVPPFENLPLNAFGPVSVLNLHIDSLSPGLGFRIPPIKFGSEDIRQVGISLDAKDVSQKLIGFWLWFAPTNLAMPYCSRIANLGVTNNGFFISIPLQH